MKVDLKPLLPQIEKEIELVFAPPFLVYEAMLLIGTIGKLIHEAEAIQTEEEYIDAWSQLTDHVIEKYNLFEKLDALIKLPIYAEPFDGWALRKGWDACGAALAHLASEKIG